MSYRSDAYYRRQSLFSQKISQKKDPYSTFLTMTAMMDKRERIKLAKLEALKLLTKYDEKMSYEDFLEQIMKPIIKFFGLANFWRSELTMLGFMAGIEIEEIDYEKEDLEENENE